MPVSHTRPFRVRHYECDAFGYLAHACYLRYMQEAAFDASAAAGYSLARYAEMGRSWIIRETEIEVFRPLCYDEQAEVITWVADFRRVRSRRAYEMRLAGTSEPVARAITDWAFLETDTGRPAAIPAEMRIAFFPEGDPPPGTPRRHGPREPAPATQPDRMRRRVSWSEIDPGRHVNNTVYVAWAVDSAMQALADRGWPAQRLRALGLRPAPCRQQIEYLQPALPGDELELTTWLFVCPGEALHQHWSARRPADGALLARSTSEWACLDASTGQPAALPAGLLDAWQQPAGWTAQTTLDP